MASSSRRVGTAAAVVAALAVPATLAAPVQAVSAARPQPRVQHVLLISVDGMHQSDLAWWDRTHPHSTLARLSHAGTTYTQAMTPAPSDSFPGLVGQMTGGNPRTTGIYYDVSYNRQLLPPGTTDCSTAKPGAGINMDESLDKDSSRLAAGQGLAGLPNSILQMTGQPHSLINPAALPVDPTTCKPVYPEQYLQVNSVFDVLHAHHRRTAWSDKHPAYSILEGRSGHAVDDLFTPEINSAAPHAEDWTKDNSATQQYDGYKVQAVLNEIDGFNHQRTQKVGTPALLGMNFQSVSTAQKLTTSGGMAGGYTTDGTPGPVVRDALGFVDRSLGRMVTHLRQDGLAPTTRIIVSAKHGQSPILPQQLTRIDDGPIIDQLNADWAMTHPDNKQLVTWAMDDDSMLLWLSDRSDAAVAFAKQWLLSHPATGNTITGSSRTLPASGLTKVYAGSEAAQFYGVSVDEPRHPDIVGVSAQGVVYTGGKGKIAEHGGMSPDDRHVLLVVAPATGSGRTTTVTSPVETTQIAPTILRLLGYSPAALEAVRIEGTQVLPSAH